MVWREESSAEKNLQESIVRVVINASEGALTRMGALAVLESNSWDLASSCSFAAAYYIGSRGAEGKLEAVDITATPHDDMPNATLEYPLCLSDGFDRSQGQEVPGCGH